MVKTAAELYREREKRVMDVVQGIKPDRVPVILDFGYMAARYAGMTYQEALYNLDKWVAANRQIVQDFAPDIYMSNPFLTGPALEIIASQTLKWPGIGLGVNQSPQYVEGELMKADEYDLFLSDPSDFIVRTYLPRTAKKLAGLEKLPRLSDLFGLGIGMAPLGMLTDPDVVLAFESVYKMALISNKWAATREAFVKELEAQGFPAIVGVVPGMPPFDYLSDFLRGMRGTMLDMYRQPKKLLEAIERLLPFALEKTRAVSVPCGTRLLFMGPHRGADDFMSLKQFETFYWPGLKAVILAAIDTGFIPYIFWEGNCTSRLEHFAELPPGKVIHRFDRSDMIKARKILGKGHCIAGGILPSLLQTGTVREVREQCRKLIDAFAQDGGYIMTTSCVMDEANPENVRAMVEFTKDYGVY
jgi:hypothetical protein